jgi:3-deoxy-D-manno-octulosonate 8-phosphate phosphatase (KDO 8-P phosphatase)
MSEDVSRRASQIRLALFDVDGVMTDGTLFISERGESFKPFNILDGLGLKLLKASGVSTGILTGRSSASVEKRASELAIDHLIQGAENKLRAYADLREQLGLEDAQVCYMGDDLPDLPVLRRCGLALSPPEAVMQVREQVHLVTHTSGGRGAVREACELIMQAQGTWESQIGAYLA